MQTVENRYQSNDPIQGVSHILNSPLANVKNSRIYATVLADSRSPMGDRITTIGYVAPRSILAEINTHRMFSRNAASSRAIPTAKIIQSVTEQTFYPVWNTNKKGMQGDFDVPPDLEPSLNAVIDSMRDSVIDHIAELQRVSGNAIHKQTVNRYLEPFVYVKGVITSTNFSNFMKLRLHPAAQPEFVLLANAIRTAIMESTPRQLSYGEWHTPYATDYIEGMSDEQRLQVSAARCARCSYQLFDQDVSSPMDADLQLCRTLLAEKHMSPFEHQATPVMPMDSMTESLQGNFQGWAQFRQFLDTGTPLSHLVEVNALAGTV